jgi:hypothetical protein
MKMGVNPSGAAAPLNEEGYSAVADRCCQAEMEVFITRIIADQGLTLCEEAGLKGFTPWHACEAKSSFDKLLGDLLSDSTSQCPWVRPASETCAPLPGPPACPEFPDAPPASECSCSSSSKSTVNLRAATLTHNNLDGQGPGSGAAEMLVSGTPGAGTTSTGQPFDIKITTLAAYTRGTSNNELTGDFGKILVGPGTSSSFKFSFVQPGTNTPVTMPEIHMAVFDLDGRPNGKFTEATSSKGYAGYVTDPNPNMVAAKTPDGRTEFKGTASGSDPSTATALTEAQKKSSLMFFYKNVSSFELHFGTTATWQCGLLFSFASGLEERCGP